MKLYIDDEYWKKLGEIPKDSASNNKLLPYNGVGFIYGLPASRKTTIAINTVKSMKKFKDIIYVDCDSKSIAQVKSTYSVLSKSNFHYCNSLLQDIEPQALVYNVLDSIKDENDGKPRCVIVDTWHQLVDDENKNKEAKLIMKEVRTVSLNYNTLIIFIAHVGKSTDDIRGASAVSGDATFKVLITKLKDMDNEYNIKITKDSLGLLKDSTAVITKVGSITSSIIKYSSELKEEEKTMKPKELAVTTTMLEKVNKELKKSNKYSVGELRTWLYDNFNKYNSFKPQDPLFCSERFIRDNFVDFTESLFVIEREGRNKYIVDFLYQEDKEKEDND